MSEALPPPRTVDNDACTGEVYDQGAQVTRWAPVGSDPVLYVSTDLRLAAGRSIRAGVPVCWPWFGPGRVAGMEPMHGFVRTATWDLVEVTGDDDETDGGLPDHLRRGVLAALAAPLRRRAARPLRPGARGVADDDEHR